MTNVRAFLTLIAWSEGTDKAADPYRCCYAYRHTLVDMSEHPAVTGEWKGERLPDAMCRKAGIKPPCVSTAAGRYQLIRPTWVTCRDALDLPDFSPDSQDRAAIHLIQKRGALDDVHAGRVAAAIVKCRLEWASLPGAGYGQPERAFAGLQEAYLAAGGTLA
jgi:muramidase (phage lysozyme)